MRSRLYALTVLAVLCAPFACSNDPGNGNSCPAASSSATAPSAGNAATGSPSGSPSPAADIGAQDASTSATDAATAPDSGLLPDGAIAPAARGATLPYVEYEAELGATNGTVLGPSRAVDDADVFKSIAGESSGRSAVRLDSTGQYVRFTTVRAANSVVVRFVLPDSADGAGQQATIGLYVNGARVASLALTSAYAWAYGNAQTTDATTNNPGDGHARHFYDEARLLLPQDVPAGATLALQRDASDTAPYYVVDLVDLEEVDAAPSKPAGALSVTDYGATPDDGSDDGNAIQSCINDAQSKNASVWIPPGMFLDANTVLNINNVAVSGAGMWRSTISGAQARFVCGTTACRISNLALLGDVKLRDDGNSIAGLSGVFGTGSRFESVWIEHFTTGAWIGVNGTTPADGLVVHGARFRDTFADGININNGVSHATIEQSSARNTGDDGFASWSYAGGGGPPNVGNVFRFNTVQLPWRANCFAIYGGQDNSVTDSVCADVVTYPGIFIDQEFNSHPFAGTTTIARNTVARAGGPMFAQQWGAVTISGHDAASPITGVVLQDLDIEDATFAGLEIVGTNDAIDGLSLTNLTITNPGTYGVFVASGAHGSATASGVVVTNGSTGGLDDASNGAWSFTRQAGNAGW